MKKITLTLLLVLTAMQISAQGWPADYKGVMLQGFYWDSFAATKWTNLESQANELAQYFDLIWIPQSARAANSTSMGYDPLYWFSNYNSSFGTEAQLRSLINTFKAKGVGIIGDVVINHRGNVSNNVDFPSETYNGVTYQLKSTDICRNDDGGSTLTWATQHGYSLSSNNDTGEDWSGMRDLDHKSANVQNNVNAYLKFLINDLGYTGFRYDMVKGFSASYVGQYNNNAKPTFSVGENWSSSATIINWIKNTAVDGQYMSAAFDFQFRYTMRNACHSKDWSKLDQNNENSDSNWPLISDNSKVESGKYRQFAVTFVENHDTERRSNAEQDPLKNDTLAANAFMMVMPGTPCVFLRHWIDCKQDIKGMIDIRKAMGIRNTDKYYYFNTTQNYIARTITGENGRVLVVAGDTKAFADDPSNTSRLSTYAKAVEGYHYAYYLLRRNEMAWIDKASGEYEPGQLTVTMTAVSQDDNARIVYTTDGSEPTPANGTQVASGTQLEISESLTLKAGLLTNGAVTNIQTRTYTFAKPYDGAYATVYLKDPTAAPNNWSKVYFYAWDGNNLINDSWPGVLMKNDTTATTTVKGTKFYYRKFKVPNDTYSFNIIFDQGDNSHQTVDITGINSDRYFEVTSTTNKYTVKDITAQYSGEDVVGDVDGNGIVDITDMNIIINVILGLQTDSRADVDGNGITDITDMNLVINIILGL